MILCDLFFYWSLRGGKMAKILIGLLIFLFFVLAILLLFIVVFGAALMIFGRKGKKGKRLTENRETA